MTISTLKYGLGRLLPGPLLSQLRSRLRRYQAARRRLTKQASIARHGCFDAKEMLQVLRSMGVAQGAVVFVQTSFNDLHTFSGRPSDVVGVFRELVGPRGTLLMPAYTFCAPNTRDTPLRLEAMPTYTGIVNELFRRSSGVVRSLHPRHSICAEGPLALELLQGHETCLHADGPGSPFDRLRKRDDAYIVTLGLSPGFASFLHWIEDIEPDRLPMSVHDPVPKHYWLHGPTGDIVEVSDMQLRPEMSSRLNLKAIADTLTETQFRQRTHRGATFCLYQLQAFSDHLVKMRDAGIFHYR